MSAEIIDIPNTHFFVAFFEDGTRVEQNADDKSEKHPEKNCFYDVLEHQKVSRLVSFVLAGPFDRDRLNEQQLVHTYGVDLRDGHFEVDGVPFFPYRVDREKYTDFQLIYLRTLRHDKPLRFDEESGEMVSAGETVSYLGYTVGFKARYFNSERTIERIIKI